MLIVNTVFQHKDALFLKIILKTQQNKLPFAALRERLAIFMNVYDFDETIYDGDSTVDFYFYCLRTYPLTILRSLPSLTAGAVLYLFGALDKTGFKQRFYRFLRGIPDIDQAVDSFWDRHIGHIKPWYQEAHQDTDVIISASPEFLLFPACRQLQITHLYASKVDRHTGVYTGVNCHGKEKVRRYREVFGDAPIDSFYSDSLSDTPLAELAAKSYLVKGSRLLPWDSHQQKKA